MVGPHTHQTYLNLVNVDTPLYIPRLTLYLRNYKVDNFLIVLHRITLSNNQIENTVSQFPGNSSNINNKKSLQEFSKSTDVYGEMGLGQAGKKQVKLDLPSTN